MDVTENGDVSSGFKTLLGETRGMKAGITYSEKPREWGRPQALEVLYRNVRRLM